MSFDYKKNVNKNRVQSFSSPRDRQLRASTTIQTQELSELRSEIDRLKLIISSSPQVNIEERLYTEAEVNSIVAEAVKDNTLSLEKEVLSLQSVIDVLKEQINNLTSVLGSSRSQVIDTSMTNDYRPSVENVFVDPIDSVHDVEKCINVEDINKSNISGSLNKLKSILGDKSK